MTKRSSLDLTLESSTGTGWLAGLRLVQITDILQEQEEKTIGEEIILIKKQSIWGTSPP